MQEEEEDSFEASLPGAWVHVDYWKLGKTEQEESISHWDFGISLSAQEPAGIGTGKTAVIESSGANAGPIGSQTTGEAEAEASNEEPGEDDENPNSPGGQSTRKRKQVKNACTNCQKACKKCDASRPCLRCVHYGVEETCADSERRGRRKGVKRGPYKKRDKKVNT
jgi:hypothetical protein